MHQKPMNKYNYQRVHNRNQFPQVPVIPVPRSATPDTSFSLQSQFRSTIERRSFDRKRRNRSWWNSFDDRSHAIDVNGPPIRDSHIRDAKQRCTSRRIGGNNRAQWRTLDPDSFRSIDDPDFCIILCNRVKQKVLLTDRLYTWQRWWSFCLMVP